MFNVDNVQKHFHLLKSFKILLMSIVDPLLFRCDRL